MGIDSSLPRKTTLAFDAAEPMSSKGINMTSTVVADVGLTEWCTQTETNSYISWLCDHPFASIKEYGSFCLNRNGLHSIQMNNIAMMFHVLFERQVLHFSARSIHAIHFM